MSEYHQCPFEQPSPIISLPETERIWHEPILTETTLGTYLPHRFLFLGWDVLKGFFDELRERPVLDVDDCRQWLHDLTDLESQMHLAYQHLHTLKALHPDDPATACFKSNLDNHQILWETARQTLYERLLAFPWLADSSLGDLRRMRALFDARVSAFSWSSFSTENQIKRLGQSLENLESQVADQLPEDVYNLSDKTYWLLHRRASLKFQKDFDSVAHAMLEAYRTLARWRRSSDMLEYALRAQDSLDYSPEDVIRVSQRILERFGPLARRCVESRAHRAGVKAVRPWHDLDEADILYLPELSQSAVLESRLTEALALISPKLREIFVNNRERFVMSPYQSDTKIAGAFVTDYARMDRHFLSCDLDGGGASLNEIFHELTHLIHDVVANQHQTYYWYRNAPSEISEGLAMALELIATHAYPLFFDAPFVDRARSRILEEAIMNLVEVALDTAYEAEIHRHTNPSLSGIWTDISDKANLGIDWQKLYKYRQVDYIDKLDLLASPFAGVKYLFGGLIALQLYGAYLQNSTATMDRVLATMKAGDSLPLPELYILLDVPFLTDIAAVDQLATHADELLSSAWKTQEGSAAK